MGAHMPIETADRTQPVPGNEPDHTASGTGYQLRLMHLMSPSLPTGSFAYSQGLEWAVEAGWVTDMLSFEHWLTQILHHGMAYTDIPILKQIHAACRTDSLNDAGFWIDTLLALRETRELFEEEQTRGRALCAILARFHPDGFDKWADLLRTSQLAGYAFAASRWNIPLKELACAYLWSWLENQVTAGIKLIPLGQSQGHELIFSLDHTIFQAADHGLALNEADIGASLPAVAIGSSRHETQYTRLFRS